MDTIASMLGVKKRAIASGIMIEGNRRERNGQGSLSILIVPNETWGIFCRETQAREGVVPEIGIVSEQH
jgi:hypothetical protein